MKCQYFPLKIVGGQAGSVTGPWLEVGGFPGKHTSFSAALFCLVFVCYLLK